MIEVLVQVLLDMLGDTTFQLCVSVALTIVGLELWLERRMRRRRGLW